MVHSGHGDFMFQKKINGAWSDIETVKRKTNGAWENCSEVQKKFNGVWSIIWLPAKEIEIYKDDSTNGSIEEYRDNIMIRNRNINTVTIRSEIFYLSPYHTISYDYTACIYTNSGGSLEIGAYVKRKNWMGPITEKITSTSSGADISGTYSFKNSFNETLEVHLLIYVCYSDFYIKNCKLIETYGETGATAHKLFC